MSEHEQQGWEQDQERMAGPGPFERSENGPGPAEPPAGPGGPTAGVPGASSGEAVGDDGWEADVPPAESLTDEARGLPDLLSWAADLPMPAPRKIRRRGTLAPAVERPLMPLSPQQKLLLLDTWQRSGLPARDFAALVTCRATHAVFLEAAFRGVRSGGTCGSAARGQEGKQAPRTDQADDPDAQAGSSRLGLRANQRHACARSGAAGEPQRRSAGVARSRL